MSPEELKTGPNVSGGPDLSGPITVIKGKDEGGAPGFFVEDCRGVKFLLKFDPPPYPELNTSTGVVASKIMYAAGYNVPEDYLVEDLDLSKIVIGKGAKLKGELGKERLMTQEDLHSMLSRIPVNSVGQHRAIASRLLPGKLLGAPPVRGTRKDDPNDTVIHTNRRELRALGIVSSLINNTDSRQGNYMDIYVGEPGQGHVKHYMIDFGISFGSFNDIYRPPRIGHEYYLDFGAIFKSLFSLGIWVKPWETPEPVKYEAIGPFSAQYYNPDTWKPTFPNPFFWAASNRDKFWAAKILTNFTDEDFRAVVETGKYTQPGAADYLVRTLAERRDIIGRTFFSTRRSNPLDEFRAVPDGGRLAQPPVDGPGCFQGVCAGRRGSLPLQFFRSAARSRRCSARAYALEGDEGNGCRTRPSFLSETGILDGTVLIVTLESTHDAGRSWSPSLHVYLKEESDAPELRVVGLRRAI